MTVKLNLTIDEKIAKKSKQFAAKRGTSVSKMVQEYLEKITRNKETAEKSFAEKYAGTLKKRVPDVNLVREEYLNKKYGR